MACYGRVLLSSRDVALTAWLRTVDGYRALELDGGFWWSELPEWLGNTQ